MKKIFRDNSVKMISQNDFFSELPLILMFVIIIMYKISYYNYKGNHYIMIKKNIKYKPLNINFVITDELQNAIDNFLNCINNEGFSSEDCYRSEIDFWIKADTHLTQEQYSTLRDYYTFGGIYKNGQNN